MHWFHCSALVFVAFLSSAAAAQEYQVGSLRVSEPWSRATPKGAPVAGGYLRIRNVGQQADRLLRAESDAARRVELHSMATENGVMRMRPVKDGLEIKAGETVELKPGSFHLMFIEPSRTWQSGERVKAKLSFERAGTVEVEFPIRPIGAQGAQNGHGH